MEIKHVVLRLFLDLHFQSLGIGILQIVDIGLNSVLEKPPHIS